MNVSSPKTNATRLAELRSNADASPYDFKAHFQLANFLHQNDGDLNEALLHYGQALALNADTAADMLIGIGQVYWMMAWKPVQVKKEISQDFTRWANDALRYLDLAIAKSAHFFRPHLDRAQVLLGLHRWEEAQHEYEWLLREDPDNPEYLAPLSRCLFNTGRMASARRAAEQALKLNPDEALMARSVLDDLDGVAE
jgi:tetratricopeptide (TPR) repeat protein